VSISLHWEGEPAPHHAEVFETASTRDDFLSRAWSRVYASLVPLASPEAAQIRPLAVGGAMAVYKITFLLPQQSPYCLVGKIPHARRIVYAAGTDQQSTTASTRALLERLVALAEHLGRHAPGLFPRSGGVWYGQDTHGTPQYLLVEEFISGVSVERLKHTYEEQFTAGHLTQAEYERQRAAAERLAVAAFIRLWDSLGRHTFTSDPSPWNVLVQASDTGASPATIIDLHSLEDDRTLADVLQRLGAVYGMRQEMLDQVILPGVLDTLGSEEGPALLRQALPNLEAQAERSRRNLGIDLHQPLLDAIRKLV
jgi:hypothetical protein